LHLGATINKKVKMNITNNKMSDNNLESQKVSAKKGFQAVSKEDPVYSPILDVKSDGDFVGNKEIKTESENNPSDCEGSHLSEDLIDQSEILRQEKTVFKSPSNSILGQENELVIQAKKLLTDENWKREVAFTGAIGKYVEQNQDDLFLEKNLSNFNRTLANRNLYSGKPKIADAHFSGITINDTIKLETIEKNIQQSSDDIWDFLYEAYKILAHYKNGQFWKWFHEVFRNYKDVSPRTADYHIRKSWVIELLKQLVHENMVDREILLLFKKLSIKSQYELYQVVRPQNIETGVVLLVQVLDRVKDHGEVVTHFDFMQLLKDVISITPMLKSKKNPATKAKKEISAEKQRMRSNKKWKTFCFKNGVNTKATEFFGIEVEKESGHWANNIGNAMKLWIQFNAFEDKSSAKTFCLKIYQRIQKVCEATKQTPNEVFEDVFSATEELLNKVIDYNHYQSEKNKIPKELVANTELQETDNPIVPVSRKSA
jgi:hypothetical protein